MGQINKCAYVPQVKKTSIILTFSNPHWGHRRPPGIALPGVEVEQVDVPPELAAPGVASAEQQGSVVVQPDQAGESSLVGEGHVRLPGLLGKVEEETVRRALVT